MLNLTLKGCLASLIALGLPVISPAKVVAARSAHDLWPTCSALPAEGDAARTIKVDPLTIKSVLKGLRPGDLVLLGGGEYGAVVLTGDFPKFVTVAAAPGQTPHLSGLVVQGSHWLIKNLTVSGPSKSLLFPNGWNNHAPLVDLRGDNMAVIGATIATSLHGQVWRAEVKGQIDPHPLSSAVKAVFDHCVTISDSHLFNIFNGIAVGGNQVGDNGHFFLIDNNKIDNFAGDGVDYMASDVVISHNLITDTHDTCAYQCIHMDGIQGWTYQDSPTLTNSNILIDSNMIIQQTSEKLEMASHDVHGITIFDGGWKNVRVINNVVVGETWNGITMNGVDDLQIINNTVLTVGARTARIYFGKGNEGNMPGKVTVKNNICKDIPLINKKKADPARAAVLDRAEISHNILYGDRNPEQIFRLVDVQHWKFNLRPLPNSGAIGAGSSEDAPTLDIAGAPRHAPVSIGAYQDAGE